MAIVTGFRSWPEQKLIDLANAILRGQQEEQNTIFKLAAALRNRWKRFGYARKLLWLARSDSNTVINRSRDPKFLTKLRQKHALCTYKDNDLPADVRFDRAFKILSTGEDLSSCEDCESLGLAGAIFKYRWEMFGQIQDLERSLLYYGRGWSSNKDADGYNGINAAYVLDLLAYQEEVQAKESGLVSASVGLRRTAAQQIRLKLSVDLPLLIKKLLEGVRPTEGDELEEFLDWQYWVYVTLGEACLGLGANDAAHFEAGRTWLAEAAALNRYEWMLETTARQLASLTRLLSLDHKNSSPAQSGPWALVEALVGQNRTAGVRSAFIGKVGLALSGGGFRAALFHIGVLARLAELDVLRHIEYLSGVSGGSIIGAHYYLEIRKLLERKSDDAITRDDYIQIVKTIEKEFLAGVQKNVRMRSLTNFWTNFKHDLTTGVLPTERTGELYEDLLFSRVQYEGEETRPRFLRDLIISVKNQASSFRPKDQNWCRANKLPILILNCTTLNTGHNWQFTATWMGEPPATLNNEVDAALRLRRMYYSEAPVNYRPFPIGRAVAASAGVPALFAPVELPTLFNGMTVRLGDGGMHDNQGVASLLEQGCTVLLVSDASGQIASDHDPGRLAAQSALRSNDILQERVRVAQYQDLESRVRSSLLRSLMFLHLKKGLDSEPLDWIGCLDPFDASDEARPAAEKAVLTPYGIHKKVQGQIAAIRTDLDSFHDAEAYALMASGYKMTKFHFPQNLKEAVGPDAEPEPWRFLQLEEELTKPESPLSTLLGESSNQLFKVWNLSPALGRVRTALKLTFGLAVAALALWLCFVKPGIPLLTSGWLGETILGFIAISLIGSELFNRFEKVRNPKRELMKWIVRIAIAAAVAIMARIHLCVFDRLYLRKGELKNVLPQPPR